MDVVAIMIFEYLEFRFRIWDSFSNLKTSNNQLGFRCSVYNPQFIMPSQTSLNIEVNIPPKKCIFELKTINGDNIDEKTPIQSLKTMIRL